jgi:hypothetical protein
MQQPEDVCPPSLVKQTLAPEALLTRAANLARLDDFGPNFDPALSAFQDMFGTVALTHQGLRRLAAHAIQALVTRLRLVRAERLTPELFAGQLNDPLVIVSLGRSGSSYLHRLLSCLPGRRYLTSWEVMEPIADAEEDDRIANYAMLTSLFAAGRPEFATQHHAKVDGPQECMFLLDPSLVSLSFTWFDAPCPAYYYWVHDPRHTEPYRIYRKLLLYLQATAPEQKLVLKSPAHFGQLQALLQAVPEARLVHTHRDPLQLVGSMCSVRETMVGSSSRGFDRQRIGRETLAGLESMIARNAEQRLALLEHQNFDLGFDELTRTPSDSVARICAHFGLPWDDSARAALQVELSRNETEPTQRHRYDIRDYGLEADEVNERLAAYRRRFGFT